MSKLSVIFFHSLKRFEVAVTVIPLSVFGGDGRFQQGIVGPRKMHSIFCRKNEESGHKGSKVATKKERSKSNPGIRHVLRKH